MRRKKRTSRLKEESEATPFILFTINFLLFACISSFFFFIFLIKLFQSNFHVFPWISGVHSLIWCFLFTWSTWNIITYIHICISDRKWSEICGRKVMSWFQEREKGSHDLKEEDKKWWMNEKRKLKNILSSSFLFFSPLKDRLNGNMFDQNVWRKQKIGLKRIE